MHIQSSIIILRMNCICYICSVSGHWQLYVTSCICSVSLTALDDKFHAVISNKFQMSDWEIYRAERSLAPRYRHVFLNHFVCWEPTYICSPFQWCTCCSVLSFLYFVGLFYSAYCAKSCLSRWIIHYWLPLWLSLPFIYYLVNAPWYGWYLCICISCDIWASSSAVLISRNQF